MADQQGTIRNKHQLGKEPSARTEHGRRGKGSAGAAGRRRCEQAEARTAPSVQHTVGETELQKDAEDKKRGRKMF